RRKRLQAQVESLQAERNQSAKAIGKAKAAGEDIAALKQAVAGLGEQLAQAKQALAAVRGQLQQVQHGLPNIAHASVPVGADETETVELRRWGELPQFAFEVRDPLALGEAVAGMEAATAAHMTGARFMVMRGAVARLHRALIQFMLDIHTREHGYEEFNVPYIVRSQSLFGTGQLPKFGDDLFRLRSEEHTV